MPMIVTVCPTVDPTWAGHWSTVASEWQLAARETCELNARTHQVAQSYLTWEEQLDSSGSWWTSSVDWSAFEADLKAGRTGLSSVERALAEVAVGLVLKRGTFEYHALHHAGYLEAVSQILSRASIVP